MIVIILSAVGGALFIGGTNESDKSLSQDVLNYTAVIQKYANQFNVPEYISVIQAMMMQESGGRGQDPMQSSACPFNTAYKGGITDPEYSIQVGIQYFALCLQSAKCTSPNDIDKLKLSLQGYNYGNGYIAWALRLYGGYSEANALLFSREQAVAHGWPRYGDPEYVQHVLRYYLAGNIFLGLFGNGQIVEVARSQIGNIGGQPYWSWYGFNARVSWCACFVSWCAEQSGLIDAGLIPKFAYCPTGIQLFKEMNRWQGKDYIPSSGDIIFFDRQGDGVSDHVGIVEKYEDGTIYTIEGNSSDSVKQKKYLIENSTIFGYGILE
jgi:hypothetical protein